jgi:hypothetical protein
MIRPHLQPAILILAQLAIACGRMGQERPMNNPVASFEIPVTDLPRAMTFYGGVFGFQFAVENVDGNEMAWFPSQQGRPGASGALVKGESYRPSLDGSRLYFTTSEIDATLKRANDRGGRTIYPVTSIGDLGWVAEFEDSEGNRIALHSSVK